MDFADLNEKFFDTAIVVQAKRDRYRAIGVNIRGVVSVVFAVYGTLARAGCEGILVHRIGLGMRG